MQTHESNKHITCRNWEIDQFHAPQRSRLYSLKPISLQNQDREGLISYICRLAEAHSVSPGILIKQEILPSFKKQYTVGTGAIYRVSSLGMEANIAHIPKPTYKKNINERGLLAFQYSEGLQPLGCIDNLESLTFSFQMNQALQGKELASLLRRWCPKCFQATLDNGTDIYEPLAWSIDAIKICPVHRYPLQKHCPHCGKTQRSMTGKMQVGRCSQCFEWLNQMTPTMHEADILGDLDWQKFVSETILIALTNEDGVIPTHLRESIRAKVAEWNQSRKPTPTDFQTFQAQSSLLATLLG